MSRSGLYVIIGALLLAVGGFAVYSYQQETKPEGIELKLDENGVSLQKN